MGGNLRTVSREDPSLADRLEVWLSENRKAMVEDIFTAIETPSIKGPATETEPYGPDCANMLKVMGKMAEKAGFSMENLENHCGTTILPGTGEETIGIFSHVDTVPLGEGWSFPPFTPFLKEGYLYGRGATDDKGPAVAALYVMKCLRDLKIPLKHNIMVYWGCDEESTMDDLRYYLQHREPPKFSLVPDARFSVCCGEKGIASVKLAMDLKGTGIRHIEAGSSENVVPAFAEAQLECTPREAARLMAAPQLEVVFANGAATVHGSGIAAHAAFPEHSENALDKLLQVLSQTAYANPETNRALDTLGCLAKGYLGKGLGIQAEDPFFGPLTCVAGLARTEGGRLELSLNIRYPISTSGEKIRSRIQSFCRERGVELVSFDDNAPAYMDPNGQIPVLLNELCCQVLKEDFAPYSMGGGTYARHLPNALACGPLNKHLDRPGGSKRGGGHQPDECICLESLENLIRIYVRAIARIDQMI